MWARLDDDVVEQENAELHGPPKITRTVMRGFAAPE
jgi:hypothetical protein